MEAPKSSSATAVQQTSDSYIDISDVVKAEIIWTSKIVECGFPLRSSDNQSDLFSIMFPDSAIARGSQMGRTTVMYERTHGLTPYFKSILVDSIGRSDVYTYSFDESLNEVTKSSDLYVRSGMLTITKFNPDISVPAFLAIQDTWIYRPILGT